MKNKQTISLSIILLSSFVLVGSSYAQYKFADFNNKNTAKFKTTSTVSENTETVKDETDVKDKKLEQKVDSLLKRRPNPRDWKTEIQAPNNDEYKSIRVDYDAMPLDEAILPKMARDNYDDEQYIFLYMKDFSISKTVTGKTKCDMTFFVDNQTNNLIGRLSYKLQWKSMKTSLSFNNIVPRMDYSYAYSLFGEGCYSMDGTPNIIVNKCRIKGKTQDDCANMIVWQR